MKGDSYGIFMDRPSNRYDEALPLGNGKLGAMVGGQISERFIWINEETVWYGGPRDRNNPDAINHIGKIKELISQNQIKDAERLAVLTLTGVPETQRHYSTLGIVVLNFDNHVGEVSNYYNYLDFKTATTTTSYEINNIKYEMKVHVNQKANVIIVKVTASESVLDFYAGIERGERVSNFSYGTHEDEIIRDDRNGIITVGNCGGKKGLDFAASIFGESNGETILLGDKIVIRNASEAVIYISGGTNYIKEDVFNHVVETAINARKTGYEICYKNHLEEWTPLYNNVSLKIQSTEELIVPPMNKLFEAFEKDDFSQLECIKHGQDRKMLDDYLVVLFFNFGRYILLSSSRKCELPATLQGLWCNDLIPVWDGKYTTNINLEMNYWAADSANMSCCFEPYIRLAERLRENGTVTAKKMYGCRGFVVHNNTDIWADTAVQDSGEHCSYWFVGGVWIAVDMYEHYRYTQNKLLLNRVWPIMRDAALFVLDFMTEKDGELVMGVTTSPENYYVSEKGERLCFHDMCAMDAELIELLFDQCVKAYEVLEQAYGFVAMDAGFIDEVKAAKLIIKKPHIGRDGSILEWGFEAVEHDPGHRHLSHLIGAYPYNNITEKDKDLFEAVDISLNKRIEKGGCYTGFGRAWGAGLKARLKKGDEACEMVNNMVRYSSLPNLMSVCNIKSIPKLLDNTKPMQIDGTMGTVQAVIEMLIQSYNDELIILPALSKSWSSGSFMGLVSRGNIVVDAEWSDMILTKAVLKPRCNVEYCVSYEKDFIIYTANEQIKSVDGKVKISFIEGHEYCMKLT